MAYADNLPLKINMNHQEVTVKNGKGYFSIDPATLNMGQESLTAEIIFPDTIYTTSILITQSQ